MVLVEGGQCLVLKIPIDLMAAMKLGLPERDLLHAGLSMENWVNRTSARGHGGACLALGGQVDSLTSVHVKCTLNAITIDLAGPVANLIVGVGALLGALWTRRGSTVSLFYTLLVAFNLFWFAGQLVFSAVTNTDDWAWVMRELHVTDPIRSDTACWPAVLHYIC